MHEPRLAKPLVDGEGIPESPAPSSQFRSISARCPIDSLRPRSRAARPSPFPLRELGILLRRAALVKIPIGSGDIHAGRENEALVHESQARRSTAQTLALLGSAGPGSPHDLENAPRVREGEAKLLGLGLPSQMG